MPFGVMRGCILTAYYRVRAGHSLQAGLTGVVPIDFSRLADDTARERLGCSSICEHRIVHLQTARISMGSWLGQDN
jgi:hypothetical protein